jgi:hypothetical protein
MDKLIKLFKDFYRISKWTVTLLGLLLLGCIIVAGIAKSHLSLVSGDLSNAISSQGNLDSLTKGYIFYILCAEFVIFFGGYIISEINSWMQWFKKRKAKKEAEKNGTTIP